MTDLKHLIKAEALRLGFSYCGVARNESLGHLRPFYTGFIQRNGHAGMDYLETYMEKRLNPELVMPGTKSVIALLMNYYPPEALPETDNLIISKHACGDDYHKIIRHRMKELAGFIGSVNGDARSKCFVDSGPVLEKAWAMKCGAGWQGKNTLIISKNAGSWFFIGIMLTSLELEPDAAETDHCGACDSCVSACPTGALDHPYQLDIVRCISFQTIENREEIPENIKGKLSDRIYGCDICQDVCPYNRFASTHSVPEFLPGESLKRMRKNDWLALTADDFELIFRDSPVRRLGYQRLMRNIRAGSV